MSNSHDHIDGRQYADMLLGGAAVLREHIAELNSLNVFPVADGDTGTNMSGTIDGGLATISDNPPESIGELSRAFARSALLNARGNSGVILSQIFAGINEYLRDRDTVSARELADAYENGIKTSYASVQNPTEGTILTVFREATEYASANIKDNSGIEDFLRLHLDAARRSLAHTPDLLPALREAEVVDSGGAGYVYIAEGMYEALTGEIDASRVSLAPAPTHNAPQIDRFTRDSRLEFGYCTEFLLRLTTAKVDVDSFDHTTVVSELTAMGGESIVAYKQDDILKVHVHTFCPGDVLSAAQKYGEFLTVKVENMSLGHTDTDKDEKKEKARKSIATVAVASGEGICALFSDMGADAIINGGQTANPSIEEFVSAFESCNAENIIVLPNNKNIILAAKGAAEIYGADRVHVLETKNLMQGYAALSVIKPGVTDLDAILEGAMRSASSIVDCEITPAVRDVTVDGMEIKEGDYMAISMGHIVATASTAEGAAMAMLERADTDLCEIITLFVGADVDADRRAEFTQRLKSAYEDFEIIVYEGGQQIYDYLIAIE